jgi:hypothetical protein
MAERTVVPQSVCRHHTLTAIKAVTCSRVSTGRAREIDVNGNLQSLGQGVDRSPFALTLVEHHCIIGMISYRLLVNSKYR